MKKKTIKKIELPLDLGDFACNGCGACCRKFFLPLSPGQLMESFRDKKASLEKATSLQMDNNIPSMGKLYEDMEVIAPMVRLIRKKKEGEPGGPGYYYRCVHYDRKGHKCGIHSIRPRMCRGFPFYGRDYPVFNKQTYPKCQYRPIIIEREKRIAEQKKRDQRRNAKAAMQVDLGQTKQLGVD